MKCQIGEMVYTGGGGGGGFNEMSCTQNRVPPEHAVAKNTQALIYAIKLCMSKSCLVHPDHLPYL